MAKADYSHKLHCNEDVEVYGISIIDLNLGGMSVTNNIEEVVEEICGRFLIDPNSVIIVYRDSDGRWDGWNNSTKDFIALNGKDSEDSIRMMQQKHPLQKYVG